LTGDEYLFGKLLLGKSVLCSEFKDNIFGFHTITAFDYCAFIIANFSASFKQRVVAFFFVYRGAIIDIGTDIFVPLEIT
jgi:hypothetical protein